MFEQVEKITRSKPRHSDIIEREEAELGNLASEFTKESKTSREVYGYEAALGVIATCGGETSDFDTITKVAFGDTPEEIISYEKRRLSDRIGKIDAKPDDKDLPFVYVPEHGGSEEAIVGLIFSPVNSEGETMPARKFRVAMDMVRTGWSSSLVVEAIEVVPSKVRPEFLTLQQQPTSLEIPFAKTQNASDTIEGVRVKSVDHDALYLGYTEISQQFAPSSQIDERIDWLLKYTELNEKIHDPITQKA